jgi:predicted permease
MTEGLVIACSAGVGGLALARWAVHAGSALLLGTMPPSVGGLVRLAPMPFDSGVFLFALAAAGLATVMFALLPALQASRLPLTDAFRGHTATSRGSRLRAILVAGQVAVSLVLVVVALTLGRAGSSLGALDPGYDARGVLSINTRGEQNAPLQRLTSLLHADPRVAGVAVSGGNPLFIRTRNVAAAPAERRDPSPTRYTFVSPAYFPILRIPVNRGRTFTDDEARDAAPVAIVSAATASAFWPGGDPIGKTIRFEKPDEAPAAELDGYSHVTVVGVVPDVVSGFLMDGHDRGHIYLPADVATAHAEALLVRERTTGALGPRALQEIFRRTGPDPDSFEALPLNEMLSLQMYPVRAASWIGSLLGAIALVLAVSGLYGVLSYNLSQRTREIGIRMALGASAGSVVRLVLLQSARLAGAGTTAGGFVAFAALYVLNAAVHLRTTSLLDPLAFLSGAALVLLSAALAASLPARRAARVDPAETLRAEA